MLHSESSLVEHESDLKGAEHLLACVMNQLSDYRSFTLEELLDHYVPKTEADDEDAETGQEDEDIIQEQLTSLLRHGLVEQNGEHFSVTPDGERYHEEYNSLDAGHQGYDEEEEEREF